MAGVRVGAGNTAREVVGSWLGADPGTMATTKTAAAGPLCSGRQEQSGACGCASGGNVEVCAFEDIHDWADICLARLEVNVITLSTIKTSLFFITQVIGIMNHSSCVLYRVQVRSLMK